MSPTGIPNFVRLLIPSFMGRGRVVWLGLLWGWLLSWSGMQAAPLRVVMDDNYPPYVFYGADGQLQGILIDQWAAWEKATGRKVVIETMDWGVAVNRMRRGEFDVIDTVFKTPEREVYWDFTASYAKIEVPVFFRDTLTGITDLDSLRDFPVAVKSGDSAVDLLLQRGVTRLLFFKNYEAIIAAAEQHQVNVFVVDAPPGFYYLHKRGLGREFRHTDPVEVGEFHRAVRKGRTALVREIEAGFAQVGPEALAKIDQKWMGRQIIPSWLTLATIGYWAGLAGLLIIVLAVWNRSLRLLVERRTASLRESESRFRAVFENVGLVGLMLDREGRVMLCSDYLLTLTGWKREEVVGDDWFKRFLPPELRDQIHQDLFRKSLAAGKIMPHFENEILTRDGKRRLIAWSNTIMRDLAGEIVGVASLGVDVTEHRQAQKNAQHLANFPEMNPNPVLEFAADGSMIYCNPAARDMAQRIGFASMAELWPVDTRQIVQECLRSGQPRLRLTSQHGRHQISWSYYPLVEQQVVHCYAGDITERQQFEERLRQAQKMEAVGQLSGGVAHDFNNLLTVIIGHLGMLRTNPQVTPEIAESLEEIAGAANRAANLTRQLLAFSRHQVMTPRDLDLNQVVSHLSKMLCRVLGEDVVMQLELSPEPQTINGDSGMIEQVLLNLAVNARDAMPSGGTLRLATMRRRDVTGRDGVFHAGEFVQLTVSDTGCGIAPEVLPRIFEPFFTTKEVGKGTGLGLATVFGIVQQHEGWIEVMSEPGQGTTFHLYLPRIASAVLVPEGESRKHARKGDGETILFVEDEPSVREVGVMALRRWGYKVLTAPSGTEALTVWAQHKAEIALLLTDIIMPGGISGLELARTLLAENPRLRVIYSSGYSAEIAGKELQMNDGVNYLGKPYELDQLYHTVRMALDGNMSRAPF